MPKDLKMFSVTNHQPGKISQSKLSQLKDMNTILEWIST